MKHLVENMYSVKLLFESIHSGKPDLSKIDEFYEEDNNKLFEESIILVKAKSIEEASEIGKEFAKTKLEQKYFNMYGELVTWKLRKIRHVFELNDVNFETGTELYSRFLHVDKSLDFRTVIKNYYPECLE